MKMPKKRAALVSAAVLSLLLAACSSGGTEAPADPDPTSAGSTEETPEAPQELTPFQFQLQQPPNGSNAPFASAVEQGFYADHGLEVELLTGTGSSVTAQMVAAGQANVGYADSTATAQLIAQGAPLVVLATILQSNPNEVIALEESGISSIADLKGRTVGTPVPSSQATMLPLFLEANGLSEGDVELVNLAPTSLVQSLLQGQVDAILGSIDTYQVQVESQYDGELFTAMFADNGVATVSTSIFANKEWAEENVDAVKAFVAGSLEGWEFAAGDPEASVADLTALWGEGEASVTSLEELEATFSGNLLCAGGAEYVGKAEPEAWARTQELLSSVELLPMGIDPTTYYTYDYLPAESDLLACPIS